MMLRKDWHHHSHLCNNESVNEESGLSIGPGRRHNLKSQGSARCDNAKVASQVAATVGITSFEAELKPEDKLAYVERFNRSRSNDGVSGGAGAQNRNEQEHCQGE
eukprot:1160423-Pelagomonas_calceolata.AAC.10